jgi:hypothetical protein
MCDDGWCCGLLDVERKANKPCQMEYGYSLLVPVSEGWR